MVKADSALSQRWDNTSNRDHQKIFIGALEINQDLVKSLIWQCERYKDKDTSHGNLHILPNPYFSKPFTILNGIHINPKEGKKG